MSRLLARLIGRLAGRDGFSRSVFTLLTGTTVALAISYLAQPVLTRLYAPEAFGLFDSFAAIIGLLIPFASMRYEDAVMLPGDNREALDVLGLSVAIVAGVCLLCAGLIGTGHVLGWWNGSLTPWLWWVVPVLFVARLAKLGEQWLARRRRYAGISRGQALQAGVTAASRIALRYSTPPASPGGLIAGYLAGSLAGCLWYGSRLRETLGALAHRMVSPRPLWAAARRYRRFPLFSMPSTLLNALLSRLPFLLLLYFFDSSVVGYFGRAYALFAVPLGLIGGAVSQVFFVEGAERIRTAGFSELTHRVHDRLVMLGIFPALGLILAGPEVFGFVLGGPWETAGAYLRWIAVWLFLASVASPLTRVFDVMEMQRHDLLASIAMFVIQTSLLVAGGLSGDVTTALILLGAGGAAARIVHLAIILHLAGVPARHAAVAYLRYALRSLPWLAVLYAATLFHRPWLTTLTLLACGAGYLLVASEE